jgi:glycerol-3-phosphate dehydrogenase (NAD(P)+)
VDTRTSQDFSSGVTLPEKVDFTTSLGDFKDYTRLVLAVPSHAMRSVAEQMAHLDFHPELVVNVAKGIENDTFMRMSEVILDEMESMNPSQVVTMTGPTHAEEVSRDMPSAIVAASDSMESSRLVQSIFMDAYLRVYTNNDIIGAELGGSVKNVIAIAAGILDGMGQGDNPKAALMTRGIAEITRLGLAAGAQRDTFSGLSGIGDLIVTCLSQHSRNRHVGEQLGRGNKLDDILGEMKMVAEGVKTAKSVQQMAENYHVDMPITQQVFQVLFHDKTPESAIHDLMSRDPVHEHHSM